MGVKTMSLIWKYGPADHNQFVNLLTLGDFADDETGECYPGIDLITARARVSKSSALRAQEHLQDGDWVTISKRVREHSIDGFQGKGNTYRINLEKLRALQALDKSRTPKSPRVPSVSGVTVTPESEDNSGVTQAPDEDSGVTVAPEKSKVRCQGDTTQVSNATDSGVTVTKPPDPLKGVTTTNHHEPSFLAPEEPEPDEFFLEPGSPKRKPGTDPRHAPVWRFIRDTYRERNKANCPDAAKCNGVLATFLKGCDWSTEDLCACITHRFDSDKPPPGESPHRWISRLATWRNGALDTYNNPKTAGGNGNANRNKAQANYDSTVTGTRAALASLGIDCGPPGDVGPGDGGADGREGRTVTIDGRRPRRLTH